MLIVGAFVTQATNDSQQITPMLALLARQEGQIGMLVQLLADTGYFSAANVMRVWPAALHPSSP